MLQNLQIPHWDTHQSEGGGGGAPSPFSINAIDTPPSLAEDHDAPPGLHVFSTDHFRMFHYKIRSCPRVRSHDWTECPYAHPAEKARRRDPRKYHYSGTACPDFRKGHCRKGDSCEFAHGVFECWLHPSRYRTQLCKDGTSCRRRVCFFAHAPDQLRVLAPSSAESNASSHVSSPTSVLNYSSCSYLSESPPSSPGRTRYGVVPFNTACGVRELVSSMRNVQLDEVGSGSAHTGCVFGSPRGPSVRPGLLRVPYEEEPAMERVESGRDIRARMYAKLSKENSINGRIEVGFSAPIPDIGWVSELVK